MATPPVRRGPTPRVEAPRDAPIAPRNRWGMPDIDAIYQEVKVAEARAEEAQGQILDLLIEIRDRLPPPPPPAIPPGAQA
jgi:hypothetical protein